MSTLLDEETVVIQSLDFEVPCVKSDDHAAEVTVTCRRCGKSDFRCRRHVEELRALLEIEVSEYLRVMTCRSCGHTARRFEDLVEVVGLP